MSYMVYGENCKVKLKINDDYIDILCGEDMTLNYAPEFVLSTGPNSGSWRERKPRLEEWSASVTGLTPIENDGTTTVSWFYLLQEAQRRTAQDIKLVFTDQNNDQIELTGSAYVGTMGINGPMDFSRGSIEFLGTGEFEMDAVAPPSTEFDVFSDYWQTVNGQNYIDGASAYQTYTLASTDTILEVDLEGTQYDVVSGTPSAGTRTCQFSTSPVRVIFPSDVVFDGTQRVFVEFKRPT